MMYYSLLLFPSQPAYFYFLLTSSVFMIPGFIYRKSAGPGMRKILKLQFKDLYQADSAHADRAEIKVFNKLIFLRTDKLFVLLSLFFFVGTGISTTKSFVSGHDMLEYSIQGKYFAEHKNIVYEKFHFHPENDFYYVGLHGYSFPLLRTWEYLIGEIFTNTDCDYFFKNLSVFYYLLLYLFGFTLLSRKPFYSKILWFMLLCLPLGFSGFMIGPHIDSYRICMISLSFFTLYSAIESNNHFVHMLLFMFTGAQAFIHSLGVFIAALIVLGFFLYIEQQMKKKLLLTAIFGLVILLMGNIHYVLDTFMGTGWIFQTIKYY